jgi:hypothetical protein
VGPVSFDTRGALRLIWLGIVVQILGEFWDIGWHSANPDAMESGSDVFEAHFGIMLGALILLFGTAVAVASARGKTRLGFWLALAMVGAVLETVGLSLDSWRHVDGSESAVGHVLTYVGLLIALVGAVVATRLHRKTGVETTTGRA